MFVATEEPPNSPAQVTVDCGWAALLAALIYGPIYAVVNRKSLVASFVAGLVGAVALVPLAFVVALMFSDL
jgi:predicted membrane metal-binding protein